MTPFEQAQKDVAEKKFNVPEVTIEGKQIDYFGYQLATHYFNLKLMAKGLKFSNIKLSQLKKYYGLKGRTAEDCLKQFHVIIENYKANL